MDEPPRPFTPTIGGLMRLVFWLAVAFAAVRWGLPARAVVPTLLVLSLTVTALEYVWFVFVPVKVIPWRTKGDHARERKWLERVLSVPALGNDGMKSLPRFMLMVREQHEHRYAEAVALGRAILARPRLLKPAFASLVRQRLADCLEGLGRRAEADAERALADDTLKNTKEDFLARQAQAQLFEKENRHAEAYAAYEKGLPLVPARLVHARAEFMVHLVLTSFNAGRPADTARWAEAVLALKTKPIYHQSARKMGAIALGNLGRFDEAERLTRESAALEPDPVKRSETLALAASYVYRRGALDEAERAALDAEALSPGSGRLPWFVLAEIEKIRGRSDRSFAAHERARAAPPYAVPSAQRRIAAVIAQSQAIDHAELGRFALALALIREAEPEIGNDPKLGCSLDAAAALVSALAGNRDAALARIASAEKRRQGVPDDNETQRTVLWNLGKATHALGDPSQSESFWRAYLGCKPAPVYHPAASYYLAEARRLLGDPGEADALYRRAASTDFGTLHERLARERLAALDTAGPAEHL